MPKVKPWSVPVKRLLFEAYRRNQAALKDDWERRKTLTERWLGLGSASTYKPAVEAGLMRWIDGKAPRRYKHWLQLTEAGVMAMVECHEEFSKRYDDMCKHGYERTYAANYQLISVL